MDWSPPARDKGNTKSVSDSMLTYNAKNAYVLCATPYSHILCFVVDGRSPLDAGCCSWTRKAEAPWSGAVAEQRKAEAPVKRRMTVAGHRTGQ
ncbi:hypothetical protein D1970_01220 [Mesobacillus zeae]|uniref:Uncharacterized protein n=1 Tax=Mesobacillus zeae TaxID=1917180 RepID=A0A398BIS5_9BACI|nr:hypothetical protein D1970_01220 [Mesobacillus zeae]